MRVVAIVHNYPPRHNAGAEWMVQPMFAALAARGHKVEVFLSRHHFGPDGKKSWKLNGVDVHPLGSTGRSSVPPDVYVTHLDCIRSVCALGRGQGRPVVVVQHNTLDFDLKNIDYGHPDLLVHNSEWMKQFMVDEGYIYPNIVCRPPVNEDDYRTAPGDRVTLINLTPGKGGEVFWQVAEMMPDTKFLAVQGNYGGQIVKSLPNVDVVGPFDGRKMKDEVYARTRILMVPSAYESWGRVATEASCSGIPVLANHAIGALAENLGDAAIWCDRNDPDTWVREIKRLAKPAEYRAASEAARKQFETLDFEGDLNNWVATMETLGHAPRSTAPIKALTSDDVKPHDPSGLPPKDSDYQPDPLPPQGQPNPPARRRAPAKTAA